MKKILSLENILSQFTYEPNRYCKNKYVCKIHFYKLECVKCCDFKYKNYLYLEQFYKFFTHIIVKCDMSLFKIVIALLKLYS